MTPRRRPVPAAVPGLALALCLAVAATGCSGGDDDEQVAERSPTTTEATTSTDTTATTEAPTTTAPPADVVPVAAADPDGLARQITTAEQAIRSPATSPAQLAALGHLQQVAYRRLVTQPDWDARVLELVPPELRPVVEANVAAGRELRSLVGTPREMMPAWRIVDAAPPEELLGHYRAAEAEFGVPWPYLAAINLTETRMGRLRGTSTAGAQGPMQFIPSTWEAYGEGDINSDRDAIRAAARYLKANGAPGDIDNALYRYNPTPKYVKAVKLYAEQMIADERAYLGYYHWQVYYVTTLGDVLLEVGYEATETRPVTPEDVTGT